MISALQPGGGFLPPLAPHTSQEQSSAADLLRKRRRLETDTKAQNVKDRLIDGQRVKCSEETYDVLDEGGYFFLGF